MGSGSTKQLPADEDDDDEEKNKAPDPPFKAIHHAARWNLPMEDTKKLNYYYLD